ncbi:unnamed protein product [Ectocarpus sp. 13 AM-2016]
MFLGDTFNQPIEDVVWPPGLERLSLPGYDHPIDNVRWPPALKSLEFTPPLQISIRESPYSNFDDLTFSRSRFNSRFTTLPASLETLWLGDAFRQSLLGVNWPSGLATLGLGVDLTGEWGLSWPSILRNLYLAKNMYDWVERPPSGCTVSIMPALDTDEDEDDYGMLGELDGIRCNASV